MHVIVHETLCVALKFGTNGREKRRCNFIMLARLRCWLPLGVAACAGGLPVLCLDTASPTSSVPPLVSSTGVSAGAVTVAASHTGVAADPFPVYPATSSPQFKRMADLVAKFQDDITAAIERVDGGGKFREDRFPAPGASRIRVLQDGRVFEKAGVAVTIAQAPFKDRAPYFASRVPWVGKYLSVLPPQGFPMLAASISLVIHPHNPMVSWVLSTAGFQTSTPSRVRATSSHCQHPTIRACTLPSDAR